jgi:hypothetical protein
VTSPRYAPAIGAALYAATLAGTPLDGAALRALPAFPAARLTGR